MVEARCDGADRLGSVKGLITAGSQAPLLYEFDALQTLHKGKPLPVGFPKRLNLDDENDLLSYRADRVLLYELTSRSRARVAQDYGFSRCRYRYYPASSRSSRLRVANDSRAAP